MGHSTKSMEVVVFVVGKPTEQWIFQAMELIRFVERPLSPVEWPP